VGPGTLAYRPKGRNAAPARGTWCYDCRVISRAIPTMLELSVNGETKRFDGALDVARLLERLELAGKKVAVERNGEIVPRSRYGATPLADGDRLEIVVAVGGG